MNDYIILTDIALKKISNVSNLFGTSVRTCYAQIKKKQCFLAYKIL